MFTFMMQPTVNLCYMTSCPSVARKARKQIEEHLQDLAMYTSKWAIIEVPNFVKPDAKNNPQNKDILHFVFDGAGNDIRGEYGSKCKQLAEHKGSWLNRALTSNTLYMGNENAPGLYLVYADGTEDAVLRACVISSVSAVVERLKAGCEIM